MKLDVVMTPTVQKKRGRKPIFDPSRRWIHYKTAYLDAEVHKKLVLLAARQGIPVAQALNMALKAGLKAFR
jgi:hypothetical protein